MNSPSETFGYDDSANEFETELAIEKHLTTLAENFQDAESALDKNKTFRFEESIVTSAKLPEQLKELLSRGATFGDIELGFRRNRDTDLTTIQFSLSVMPRQGDPYTLLTELVNGKDTFSYRVPLGVDYDHSPAESSSTKIPPMMDSISLTQFIASLASHENLENLSEFTQQALSQPDRFREYLVNPFAYQHLDQWFVADTESAQTDRYIELVDAITNYPTGLTLTFIDGELIATEAELWEDKDKNAANSVLYAKPPSEEAEIPREDQLEELVYDDEFFDFGVDTETTTRASHTNLNYTINGLAANPTLAEKKEIAARLHDLALQESPYGAIEVPYGETD